MSNVIGLIGLGVMGENIARNFIDHGTEVHAFNSSEKKLNQIIHIIYIKTHNIHNIHKNT